MNGTRLVIIGYILVLAIGTYFVLKWQLDHKRPEFESFPLGGIVLGGVYLELPPDSVGQISYSSGIDTQRFKGRIEVCGGTDIEGERSFVLTAGAEKRILGEELKEGIYLHKQQERSIAVPFRFPPDRTEFVFTIVEFSGGEWSCVADFVKEAAVRLQ